MASILLCECALGKNKIKLSITGPPKHICPPKLIQYWQFTLRVTFPNCPHTWKPILFGKWARKSHIPLQTLQDVIEYDKLAQICPLQLFIDDPLGRRAKLFNNTLFYLRKTKLDISVKSSQASWSLTLFQGIKGKEKHVHRGRKQSSKGKSFQTGSCKRG